MNGVIIINKPLGKTSHDMVSYIRRLTGIKKVGHTGTLDPLATGVLPICIGKATKACDMLTSQEKSYRAQFMLGMTTDTLDCEGEVLTEQEVNVTKEDIVNTVLKFKGEIWQTPPMYSAIKVQGKKLYELAREGLNIEREKRKVNIFNISVCDIDMENFVVTIDVHCSKGTYIRTLCDDIGMELGCGAFMTSLTRTKSGAFNISKSYSVSELDKMAKENILEKVLIPVDELFSVYPKIIVNEREKNFVTNGVRIRKKGLQNGALYRVYSEDGEFLSLSRCEDERLTLEKAFWN